MLKMKKSLGLILSAVVFAGCTTVAPQVANQNSTTAKVEAVKVDPVVDLGDKNGASAKLNLRFNRDSKFGIKNVVGFASANVNSKAYLVVKLHKAVPPATMVSPALRFENPATLATATSFIDGSIGAPPAGFSPFVTGATATTIKFNGLHFGTNYYVSARAYTPANVDGLNAPVDFPPADAQITINAGVINLATPLGNYKDFDILKVNVGDVISVGINRYTVTSLVGAPVTGLNVVDFSTNAMPPNNATPTNFNLWRNVVSIDGTTAGNGGGTQGAVGAPSTEEFISVSPTGVVSITNDANTNTALDLNIQLRSDFIPQATQVNGNLTVTAGNTAPTNTETITSP